MVCGYAYNDQCVMRSFSVTGPGILVIVNPVPPQNLRDVADKRKGQHVFSGNDGYFDEFFGKLDAALNPKATTETRLSPGILSSTWRPTVTRTRIANGSSDAKRCSRP